MIAAMLLAFVQDPVEAPGDAARENAADEADFYAVTPLPAPEDVALEVGGLALLPDGRPILCTRRGYVFVVEGAYGPPEDARYVELLEGLQEPLGLLVTDGGLETGVYVSQRGELTLMRDTDGDERIDSLETFSDELPISGSYHEYNFGPRRGPDGALWLTANRAFDDEPFGRVDWRGWALRYDAEGRMTPVACGLRSPCGVEVAPWGDVFYTDNQGEWCGASKLSHIEPGDFHGHPFGLASTERPEWTHDVVHEEDVPNGMLMPLVKDVIPSFKLPAVWFPYDKMGRSPSGILWDTKGSFGPFAGQAFVGDQYDAAIYRVFLEQVNGHWQGACFRFREDLPSGVIRLAWGADDSMLVGMSDRGWGSRGAERDGFARLAWTGEVPFEIREMRALPDGFELVFTRPVNVASAVMPGYTLESYTYELAEDYGSDELDRKELTITGISAYADGRTVKLEVDGLRAGYVHELHAPQLRSESGTPLLHSAAYYTLIEIPGETSSD